MRMQEWVVNKSDNGNSEIALESGGTFVVNIIMGDLMKEKKGILTLMEMLDYMYSDNRDACSFIKGGQVLVWQRGG